MITLIVEDNGKYNKIVFLSSEDGTIISEHSVRSSSEIIKAELAYHGRLLATYTDDSKIDLWVVPSMSE